MWFRRDGCLNTLHKWYLALLIGIFLVLTLYSSISCNFPLAIRKECGHKTDTETCSEVAYNFITYLASANCLLLKCLLLCNSKHLQKERAFSGAGWREVCWLSGQSQHRPWAQSAFLCSCTNPFCNISKLLSKWQRCPEKERILEQ